MADLATSHSLLLAYCRCGKCFRTV